MAGPWEKYKANGVVASAPPVPKAPIGYVPGSNPTVAPGYVQGQARIAGAEAAAREAAQRQTIAFQTQQAIQEAIAKDRIARQGDAAKALALDPQKLANIRAVQSQIDRLNKLFIKGPGATKGFSSIMDFMPTPTNAQFDTAGAGLGEVGLAAFRVPGVGSQSDTELRAFVDANRPRASDMDARIKEKLNNLQNRLNQTYSAYGMKRSVPKSAGKVIDFNDLPE